MWCVVLTCSFCQLTHGGLEPVMVAERNDDNFFQCSMAWGGFLQAGVQDVTEFGFG
jgi:hypothetical protein